MQCDNSILHRYGNAQSKNFQTKPGHMNRQADRHMDRHVDAYTPPNYFIGVKYRGGGGGGGGGGCSYLEDFSFANVQPNAHPLHYRHQAGWSTLLLPFNSPVLSPLIFFKTQFRYHVFSGSNHEQYHLCSQYKAILPWHRFMLNGQLNHPHKSPVWERKQII